MMKAKTLILLTSALVFLIFNFNSAVSQVIYLQNDTLKVLNVEGAPGDSVLLKIYCRNTIPVAALRFRLVFDTNLVVPRTHPVTETTEAVNAQRTTRTPSNVYPMFQGSFKNGALTFLASTDWFNLTYMLPGFGEIVWFTFDIKSSVSHDDSALIKFEATLTDPYGSGEFSGVGGDTAYIPMLRNGYIHINVGIPGNHAPEIGALQAQYKVTEGDSVSFNVSATDADNDTITLYTETTLPANASFPTKQGKGAVSQRFVFKPDLTQGPDTFNVVFVAKDEHNDFTKKTVTIIVEEFGVGGDILSVTSDQGGVPGTKGRTVPIYLTNTEDIYGVQFTLRYPANLVEIDSFIRTSRIDGFSLWNNLGDSLGKVTVLIFGLGNEKILSGSGPILELSVSVDTQATCGQDATFTLSDGKEAISLDPNIGSRDLNLLNGLFAIDCFGDVNLDRDIDIADVVSLVAYILGNVSFSFRQLEAADINHDTEIDVGDLVGTINTILGRPIEPAPMGGFPAPLASVELNYQQLKAGEKSQVSILADLSVAIAGAQFKINYDPQQLSFSAPQLTSRSGDFIVQYEDDKNGKLTCVMYNLSGKSIDAGPGEILSLPAQVKAGVANEDIQINLTQVVLANPGAVVIPVKGYTNLPTKFSLHQNYPNPFNPNTTIRYEINSNLTTSVHTALKVYNILGQLVRTLVDEPKYPGSYEVVWDGKDSRGEQVSSGVYFYRMTAGAFSESKKMVMMK